MLRSTLYLALIALGFVHLVLTKPSSGSVTIINATPYNWELTSSHSYQVDWAWPSIILSGISYTQHVKFTKDHRDDGAEAYYTLVGSPFPASFIVKAQAPKHIEIQFQDTLCSLNNPENSVINIGWVESGSVSFVLSGNGDAPYISSNPPVAWMQSTLSGIGSRSLREIVMPASHDSGMNQISRSWGGRTHNTVTQTVDTFKQLVNGARSFDVRPVHYHGKIYTGHFSVFGSLMVGGTGRSLTDIVKDINSFTQEYPGELIIVDISHQMNADKKFGGFTQKLWIKLYQELDKIEALWIPSTLDLPGDLSTLPLSSFITPGSKSAVLIRLPSEAPLPEPNNNKRNIAAMSINPGTTVTDPHDDMAPLIPTLQGDDEHNSTTIGDHPTISIPTILQSTGGDNENTLVSDDSTNPLDSDSDSAIIQASASMTLLPISTKVTVVNPKPESVSDKVLAPIDSSRMAFLHEYRLPITGSYADTDKSKRLISDQLAKLAQNRPNANAEIHRSTWTITQRWQHITDVENKKTSVTADAATAHRALFASLWSAMSRNTFPNMIEVDDIRDSQVTALCMTINDYFASPRTSVPNTKALG